MSGDGVDRWPGGWVPGIGWVALLTQVHGASFCRVKTYGDGAAVIVTRWPDGSTPEAPSAGVDRWSDVEPRLLSLHQVAEMALALDHYWRWFGDDCGCNDGSKEPCPIYDGVTAARHALAPDNRDPDRPDWDRRRAALAVIPEAPVAERADGFAGYGGCPSAPCRGERASLCAAAGDCADLALRARVFGTPAPPEADSAAETLERFVATIAAIVAEGTSYSAVGHAVEKYVLRVCPIPTHGEGEAP